MISNSRPKKQQGVALVMAVMIVAFIGVIAVELSWRFDLFLARNTNRWLMVQTDYIHESAEVGAIYFLDQDFQSDQEEELMVDDLTEDWAMDLPAQEIGPISLYGKLSDAQGRFNINLIAEDNIYKLSNSNNYENYIENQKRFIRLLQTINLSTDPDYPEFLSSYEAEEITQAVIDWMDTKKGRNAYDQETGSGGAESDYYLRLEPPVTIANGPMKSITELRVIKGVTPILYERILPFVIALPKVEGSNGAYFPGLNVNTMPIELIRSLNTFDSLEPLDIATAEKIFNDVRNGVENLNEFWKIDGVENAWVDPTGNDRGFDAATKNNKCEKGPKYQQTRFQDCYLFFNTEFFILSSMSEVNEEFFPGRSLIYRDSENGEIEVLRRTTENF